MRKHIFSEVIVLMSCMMLVLSMGKECAKAEVIYENATSGYQAVISDEADLLSDEEERSIYDTMQSLTAYCNVALVTIDENPYLSTQTFAELYADEQFWGNSSIVFVIDMDERYLYLDSAGGARKQITSAYADSITDNVYKYASTGDYFYCAYQVFDQVHTLMRGRRIAQPMKYISNALLAIVFAMLINFVIVRTMTGKNKPTRNEVMSGIYTDFKLHEAKVTFLRQTKKYSPQSSSGSHSGGSRSGGGHSGGGHSGGGHKF